jgi:hypothetical protein
MWRILITALLVGAFALAKDKKLPTGEAANDMVEVNAVDFDADQLRDTIGTDFDGTYVVIEVTLAPKGGKPLDVHPDDFLLRSDQTGEHTGPLAASQIAGSETLVVRRGDPGARTKGTSWGGFGGIMMGGGSGGPAPVQNSHAEIKDSDEKDPIVNVLKRKILAEKTINEPETGLLFFPLEKEKPKNLTLVYTTAQGRLRMKFK